MTLRNLQLESARGSEHVYLPTVDHGANATSCNNSCEGWLVIITIFNAHFTENINTALFAEI